MRTRLIALLMLLSMGNYVFAGAATTSAQIKKIGIDAQGEMTFETVLGYTEEVNKTSVQVTLSPGKYTLTSEFYTGTVGVTFLGYVESTQTASFTVTEETPVTVGGAALGMDGYVIIAGVAVAAGVAGAIVASVNNDTTRGDGHLTHPSQRTQ